MCKKPLSQKQNTRISKKMRNEKLIGANFMKKVASFLKTQTHLIVDKKLFGKISNPPKKKKGCPKVLYEKVVLKGFVKFTGKHLQWSPILSKVSGMSGCRRLLLNEIFPMKLFLFAKKVVSVNAHKSKPEN